MGAFKELGKTPINDKKNLVVSQKGNGMYSIAQQIAVEDGYDKPLNLFLKNAIEVDEEGLQRVYEMIGNILQK